MQGKRPSPSLIVKNKKYMAPTYKENALYTSLFGKERWATLVDNLAEPTKYCRLINGFSAISKETDVKNPEEKVWKAVTVPTFIGKSFKVSFVFF